MPQVGPLQPGESLVLVAHADVCPGKCCGIHRLATVQLFHFFQRTFSLGQVAEAAENAIQAR